jgi:hypothetical protein
MPSGKKVPVIIDFSALDNVSGPVKQLSRRLENTMAPINRFSNSLQRLGRATGFTRLLSSANQVGQGVKSVGNEIFNLGLKIAGLGFVAVRGFQSLVNGPIKAQAGLKLTAERIGISVERLQQWRFLAEKSGIETQKLDNSFEEFGKRLGEASTGTGQLVSILGNNDPFLNALLSIDDLGEALEFFIDKTSAIKDSKKLETLFDKAFGGSGKQLINLTKLSKEERKAEMDKLRGLGLITSAQTEAFDETRKSFLDLSAQMNNIFVSTLSKFLPQINEIIFAFQSFFKDNRGEIDSFVEEFKKILPTGEEVSAGLKEFLGITKQVFSFLKDLNKRVDLLKVSLVAFGVILTGPVFVSIASLVGAIVTLVGVIGAAPIGIFIAALAGITAVITYWDELGEIVDGIVDKISSLTPGFIKNIFGGSSGGTQVSDSQFGPAALSSGYPTAATLPQISRQEISLRAQFENVPRGTRISSQAPQGMDFTLEQGFALGGLE